MIFYRFVAIFLRFVAIFLRFVAIFLRFVAIFLTIGLYFSAFAFSQEGLDSQEGILQKGTNSQEGISQEALKRHYSDAIWGEVKYKDGFTHFDYVNPDAPKSGVLRMFTLGHFDTLNPFNIQGSTAPGLSLLYDTLMKSSLDEPYSQYPLIAESFSYPKDNSFVIFHLNKNSRFHDKTPITADDVIFSFNILKKSHPYYANYFAGAKKAEKIDTHTVKFHFNQTGNEELRYVIAQLSILPQHYWQQKDIDGKDRDFFKQTLEIPVSSGAYRISKLKQPSRIEYELVPEYWAKNLPANIGHNNIKKIIYNGFLDETVALEAFKGGNYDFRNEYVAKNWAKAYDIEPVKKGLIIRETFNAPLPKRMQAFIINNRRGKFKDRRVRKALNLAFNFEYLNDKIFYRQYNRTNSYFQESVLAAVNLPNENETKYLQKLKDKYPQHVPEESFTKIYKAPVNLDSRSFRKQLIEAGELLQKAGWVIKNGRRVHQDTGEVFKIKFLLFQDLTKIILPYMKDLKRLGIDAEIRKTPDVSEYIEQIQRFDFDIIVNSWQLSLSPGNELVNFFGTRTAHQKASLNYAGIQSPAIDEVIGKILNAKTYQELTEYCQILDRLLLWNYYIIPQYYGVSRFARWNKFARSTIKPKYSYGFPEIWWVKPKGEN